MAKENKKLGKTCRNKTWQINQALIQNAYISLTKKFNRCPTLREISEEVSLSINTLEKHIQNMDFDYIKSNFRALTPDVIMAIVNSARRGNAANAKLFMQIIENWREGIDVTTGGEKLLEWKIEIVKNESK